MIKNLKIYKAIAKIGASIGLLTLTLTGCATVKEPVEEPKVELTLEEIQAAADLAAYNKMQEQVLKIEATIKSIDAALIAKGVDISEEQLYSVYYIANESSFTPLLVKELKSQGKLPAFIDGVLTNTEEFIQTINNKNITINGDANLSDVEKESKFIQISLLFQNITEKNYAIKFTSESFDVMLANKENMEKEYSEFETLVLGINKEGTMISQLSAGSQFLIKYYGLPSTAYGKIYGVDDNNLAKEITKAKAVAKSFLGIACDYDNIEAEKQKTK